MNRQRIGVSHQVLVGVLVALVFVLIVEAIQSRNLGWQLEAVNDDGSYSVTFRDGKDRLKVRSRGKIELEDERRIAKLEAGARFRVEERIDGVTHKLTVTPETDGSPIYSYRVGGDSRPFDDSAEGWLAGVLVRVYRQTGIDAEARAQRIYERDGTDGLLEEISLISSDSVAAAYLKSFFTVDDLTPADLRAALERSQKVDSDYHLARLLEAFPFSATEDPSVLEAYGQAVRRIDSDYHLRRVIEKTLSEWLSSAPTEGAIDQDALGELLELASRIDSDHEATELMKHLAEIYPHDQGLPKGLGEVLQSIDSGYSLRRAVAVFLWPSTAVEDQNELLTMARSINSDHEASELVIDWVAEKPVGTVMPEAVFQLLSELDSDHALGRSAEAVGAVVDPSQLPLLLSSASGIDGDYQKRLLLQSLLRRHGSSIVQEVEFGRLFDSVRSEHERELVQQAVEDAASVLDGRPEGQGDASSESEAPAIDTETPAEESTADEPQPVAVESEV